MTLPSTRKVAVLGTATTTLQFAPVNDPSWEIWACSPWMQGNLEPRTETKPGFDVFFEIHQLSQFHPEEVKNFLPWMKQCGKPVYVFDDLGIPTQVQYPRKAIEDQHGSAFFTSSIAWMLALAIDQRPAQIGIWGVDMANDTEYAYQKQGCLHFIALAKLVGIDVVLPSGSELLKIPAPYPDRYATEASRLIAKKIEAANSDLFQIEASLKQLEEAKHYKRGELEALRTMQRTLV